MVKEEKVPSAPLVDRFLRFLEVEKNASPHTVKNYKSDLTEFFKFNGKKLIDDINYLEIRKFLAYLKERAYLKTTVSRKLACLKSFFKYLTREQFLKVNPASGIQTPKRDRRLPFFLETKEVETLLEAAKGDKWETKRDSAILETLYSSGIRVSELVGLNGEDVDLLGNLVKVRGKGKKERIVPVGSCAVNAIKDYLDIAPVNLDKNFSPLFINRQKTRLTDRSIRRIILKYSRQA